MKFNGRGAPGCKRAGRLTPSEPEGPCHGLRINSQEPAYRRGAPERPEHAGSMPATGAKGGIVTSHPNPGGDFEPGGERHQQIATRKRVALGNGERWGNHFGCDVSERGTVCVAHGHGGDEIAIEHDRPAEGEALAPDHRTFMTLRQLGAKCRNLA